MQKIDYSDLIEHYLKNGGTVTRLPAAEKSKDTFLNPYTAWGRTMSIGHYGRKKFGHCVSSAGSKTNKREMVD